MANLYTAREITENIPNCPFSENDLGRFLRANLLRGVIKYDRAFIDENSVKDLIAFRNAVLEKSKA